jgi:mannose-6-phosphate isomerase-like protein (cupin superfamily)
MKPQVIKSSKIKPKQFGVITVNELFNTPEVDQMSAAHIVLSGTNHKTKDTRSHHFYYIIKGQGTFTLAGQKHYVETGDLVFIPKNTEYSDSGQLEMISFSHPRFSKDQVESNP